MAMTNLRLLRQLRGLTQGDVGTLVGVCGSAVGHWETGRATPNHWRIATLARYFGTKPDWQAHDLAMPQTDQPQVPGP